VGQKLNSFEELKGTTRVGLELYSTWKEKYRFPVFDGNNYLDWKFRMTVYLDKLDLLKHTDTLLSKLLEVYPERENGEAAAVAAVQRVRNRLIRNDKKCKSRIVQRIQDGQLERIGVCEGTGNCVLCLEEFTRCV
jgi:hypothetical protein